MSVPPALALAPSLPPELVKIIVDFIGTGMGHRPQSSGYCELGLRRMGKLLSSSALSGHSCQDQVAVRSSSSRLIRDQRQPTSRATPLYRQCSECATELGLPLMVPSPSHIRLLQDGCFCWYSAGVQHTDPQWPSPRPPSPCGLPLANLESSSDFAPKFSAVHTFGLARHPLSFAFRHVDPLAQPHLHLIDTL